MGLLDQINQIKNLHKQPENACVNFNLVPNYKLHKTNEPYGTHFPIISIFNMFKCIFDVTPAKVSSDTVNLYLLEAPSSPNCSLLPSSPLPSSSTTTIPLRSQQRTSSLLTTTSSIFTEDNFLAEPCRSVSTIATTIPRQSVSTRVAFLNEQVSHHPPISCFWYKSCKKASETEDFVSVAPSVVAHGFDQISAKFTGTSVKIFPGPMNKGIFVQLPNQNKEYHITHPTATISELLRASPYVVITDHTYITCKSSGTNRYGAIISYLDKKEPLNPFLLQPSTSSKETFKPGEPQPRTSVITLSPTGQSLISFHGQQNQSQTYNHRIKPINDSNNVQNQRLRVNARRPLKDNRRSGKLLMEEVDQEHCISLNED
ncbi:Oxysterol-binding protein-domain-containing protein [Phakopsora pachyrhizi]|uniref:Oxysterol-binding protein-domain-containing protein n=1 Tax=Phakopsora pachyrhizi TaxID=170000 RepID=A0AAV0BTK2_PHAPC|nr:Oxysterol-binding protein-domain-containing protein [Phakopsora pachyrhizi]